ncbi:MAG: alanine racemase [Bulleidia sp.]|nr:alanine racemase [Bulleidia sp.]
MFLSRLKENNPALLKYAFEAAKKGEILPDTYILDLDTIIQNAKIMKEEADKYNLDLYFMLKQIGRNPVVAQALQDLGFAGAVCVDYKEALCMIENGVKVANVGHLEQIPTAALQKIISSKPTVVTVYSLDKIKEINNVAKELGIVQGLLIRLTDADSQLYSGQIAGFHTDCIENLIAEVKLLNHVEIKGLTVFPALLYDDATKTILPTENINVINRGIEICNKHGLTDLNINLPSATCTASIKLIHDLGGTSGEPGHGLTGTTPLHKVTNQPEKIGYCYVSEISHNYEDKAYCYGGGLYRRGHMENVLVGTSLQDAKLSKVKAPDLDSIDYHFEIDENYPVGLTCVMCFRTQIFTTRSHVSVVKGLQTGKPECVGLYDAVGKEINRNW